MSIYKCHLKHTQYFCLFFTYFRISFELWHKVKELEEKQQNRFPSIASICAVLLIGAANGSNADLLLQQTFKSLGNYVFYLPLLPCLIFILSILFLF